MNPRPGRIPLSAILRLPARASPRDFRGGGAGGRAALRVDLIVRRLGDRSLVEVVDHPGPALLAEHAFLVVVPEFRVDALELLLPAKVIQDAVDLLQRTG